MPTAEPAMTQEEYGEAYQRDFYRTVRMVRGRGASREQAEDVAQRAWLQGWQKLDQLRDNRALLGWINTIAANDHRRSGPREARLHPLSDTAFCGKLAVNLAALDVATILKLCRPVDRALFEHQLGGLTTHEIAKQQGVSEIAIRLRAFRARRDVRASLDVRAAALRELYSEEMRATAA